MTTRTSQGFTGLQNAKLNAIAAVVALILSLGMSACDESPKQRPHTPFGVASVAQETVPAPSANAAQAAFATQKAVLAPLGAKQWSFNGRILHASGDLVFEQALSADFSAADSSDVVAWLTHGQSALKKAALTVTGELWLYPAQGEPKKLLTTPGFLPTSPDCKHWAELSQSGPQTVTVRMRATCERPVLGRMPTQAISVVAPARENPHVLTLRISDLVTDKPAAALGEISFEVSSLDRDDDGRDDVELIARISSNPGNKSTSDTLDPDASVQFIWFDRKAGLSRDANFPSKNFHDIGSIEVVRASGKTTSQRTLTRINLARRLLTSVCAEGHTPILFDQDNNSLPCQLTNQTLGFYATAELKASVANRAYGEAFTALQRAGWYSGTLTPSARADLTAEFEKSLHIKAMRSLTVAHAKPSQPSSIPRYSPLAFSAQGLLIQNAEGIVRLDPETLQESDVTEEVDTWPLTVISPQGERLLGVAYPCDTPMVTLLIAQASGVAATPIGTSLLAPRPGMCGNAHKDVEDLAIRPVDWSKTGLQVFLGGSEIGSQSSVNSRPLGSARSQNSKHAVLATDLGLLVLTTDGAELWKSDDIPAKRLRECVIDDNAQYVACIDRGQARLLTSDRATP